MEHNEQMMMLLKADEVADRLRISVRKLWNMVEDGTFPPAVTVGRRGTRWLAEDVFQYMRGLRKGSSATVQKEQERQERHEKGKCVTNDESGPGSL